MSMNEKNLTRSELRKWQALKESYGAKLAETYFTDWVEGRSTRPASEPPRFITTGHVGHDSQAQSFAQNARRKQDEEKERRRKVAQSRQPQAIIDLNLKIYHAKVLLEAAKSMNGSAGSLRREFEMLALNRDFIG